MSADRSQAHTPHTPTRARTRQSKADRTKASKAAFLETYSKLGNVSGAAKVAGVGRRTVYDWCDQDADFAEAFDEARETATDFLEQEARRRAVEGVERPVYHGGARVGAVHEYSDRLLEVLLKANRPEKYRERTSTEISGPGGGPIQQQVEQQVELDLTKMTDAELRRYEQELDAEIAADIRESFCAGPADSRMKDLHETAEAMREAVAEHDRWDRMIGAHGADGTPQ